jgi:hypothetical protein
MPCKFDLWLSGAALYSDIDELHDWIAESNQDILWKYMFMRKSQTNNIQVDTVLSIEYFKYTWC